MTRIAIVALVGLVAACGDTTNNYLPEHPSDTPTQTVAKPTAPATPPAPPAPVPQAPCRKSPDDRCDD